MFSMSWAKVGAKNKKAAANAAAERIRGILKKDSGGGVFYVFIYFYPDWYS